MPPSDQVAQALAIARTSGDEVQQVLAEEVKRLRRQEHACSTTIAVLLRRWWERAHPDVNNANRVGIEVTISGDEIDASAGEVVVTAHRDPSGDLLRIDVTWDAEEVERG
jgi:hypothetical protein